MKKNGLSQRELERLTEAVRAAELVKNLPAVTAPRPAQTYGKLRDERSEHQRLTSHAQ